MLRNFVAAIFAVIAVACTAPASTDQAEDQKPFIGIEGKPLVLADGTIDSSVQEALTADPAACAKAGGELKPVCRMQRPMCLITFSDAGKACSDGSDCGSGRCVAGPADMPPPLPSVPVKGICAATNDPCGCYQRIEDGLAQPTICVD